MSPPTPTLMELRFWMGCSPVVVYTLLGPQCVAQHLAYSRCPINVCERMIGIPGTSWEAWLRRGGTGWRVHRVSGSGTGRFRFESQLSTSCPVPHFPHLQNTHYRNSWHWTPAVASWGLSWRLEKVGGKVRPWEKTPNTVPHIPRIFKKCVKNKGVTLLQVVRASLRRSSMCIFFLFIDCLSFAFGYKENFS